MAIPRHIPGASFVRIRRGRDWWSLDDQLVAAIKAQGVNPVYVLDYEPPFAIVPDRIVPLLYDSLHGEAFHRLQVRPVPKRYARVTK
jgi:hypothetical protein